LVEGFWRADEISFERADPSMQQCHRGSCCIKAKGFLGDGLKRQGKLPMAPKVDRAMSKLSSSNGEV